MDQTYFLMGLLESNTELQRSATRQANAFKTLMMPGGIGSTHKVLIFGKDVGTPRLAGCSFKMRVT
jgi:hypothetical protein